MSVANHSLVIVNTGDGKGKSSSAFGMMARAWAADWHVAVVQFLKGPKWKTGEQKLAKHLGIEWFTLGDGFTWESKDLDETQAVNQHAWHFAVGLIESGDYDLVILDELTYCITYGWVSEAAVCDVLRSRPARTSIVLTGRGATEGIISLADTVTEMRHVKHAFDSGKKAVRGLDY